MDNTCIININVVFVFVLDVVLVLVLVVFCIRINHGISICSMVIASMSIHLIIRIIISSSTNASIREWGAILGPNRFWGFEWSSHLGSRALAETVDLAPCIGTSTSTTSISYYSIIINENWLEKDPKRKRGNRRASEREEERAKQKEKETEREDERRETIKRPRKANCSPRAPNITERVPVDVFITGHVPSCSL